MSDKIDPLYIPPDDYELWCIWCEEQEGKEERSEDSCEVCEGLLELPF